MRLAEGRCEGRISGRYRGAIHPGRRSDRTFLPDVVCAATGEVRVDASKVGGSELIIDVAELIWEPFFD